jgi:hypothetical protein
VNGKVAAQGKVDTIIGDYLRPSVEVKRKSVVSRYGIELFEGGTYRPTELEAASAIYFLEKCEIRIRIGAKDGFAMAALVVRVFDELGSLVSSLNSTEEGVEAFSLGPSHTFVYPIQRMSLMPGRYSVSVFVYRPHDPTKYLEADSFFEFEVLPALVPGGALPYTKEHGIARFVDGCALV